MVQRTEVVKAAEHRARQIIDGRRGRGPPPAPRGRGLLRPEAGQLRDRARAHHEAASAPGAQKLPGRRARSRRRSRTRSPRPTTPWVLRPGPIARDCRMLPATRHAAGHDVRSAADRHVTSCAAGQAAGATVAPLDGCPTVSACRRRACPTAPRSASTGCSSRFRAASSSTATVTVPWTGECRRCLDRSRATPRPRCREIFETRPNRGRDLAIAR